MTKSKALTDETGEVHEHEREGLIPLGVDMQSPGVDDLGDDEQMELPTIPDPPLERLVRSIHNANIHLGGGHIIAPGKAGMVKTALAIKMYERGFIEYMDPEYEQKTDGGMTLA